MTARNLNFQAARASVPISPVAAPFDHPGASETAGAGADDAGCGLAAADEAGLDSTRRHRSLIRPETIAAWRVCGGNKARTSRHEARVAARSDACSANSPASASALSRSPWTSRWHPGQLSSPGATSQPHAEQQVAPFEASTASSGAIALTLEYRDIGPTRTQTERPAEEDLDLPVDLPGFPECETEDQARD